MYICPKCKEKLVKIDKSYKCCNNHCYDIAKSGYVNLLLNNKTNSGDDKHMVEARNSFLNKDYYKFLLDAITMLIKGVRHDYVLDLGCGEGYYTNRIQSNLNNNMYGVDLSKYAVQIASKNNKDVSYSISSIYDVAFDNKVFDVILNVFAPTPINEIKRVMKQDGCLIVVSPGENHLFELKEILYDNAYKNEIDDTNLDGLKLISNDIISNKVTIKGDDIVSLFMMTPYYYKSDINCLKVIKKLLNLDVTLEFSIKLYINL